MSARRYTMRTKFARLMKLTAFLKQESRWIHKLSMVDRHIQFTDCLMLRTVYEGSRARAEEYAPLENFNKVGWLLLAESRHSLDARLRDQ